MDKKSFSRAREVAHCIIRIVDNEGNLVPTANNEVTVVVEGTAQLIGLDNGLPNDLTSMRNPVRKVAAGMALALIKTTSDQGDFSITVTSPGLEKAEIKFDICKEH